MNKGTRRMEHGARRKVKELQIAFFYLEPCALSHSPFNSMK